LECDAQGRLVPPVRTAVLLPTLRRSLLALLKVPPRAYGWCRTRWSCATLALTRQTTRGMAVSAETMRRWLHDIGWVWKRAKLVAKDDAPQRVDRLAHIRFVYEPWQRGEAMVFADELEIHLVPKVGCAWMPRGTQLAVMPPGQHQQHDLAGALDLATGTLHHGLGARQTNALFRDVLGLLDEHYPAEPYRRLYVIVDNFKIQKARAVEPWLAAHPRVTLRLLPTSCPRANPIEGAFGDGHDCGTRNHRRKRLPDLVAEVADQVHLNGPWKYKVSDLYYEPAVTAAVEKRIAQEHAMAAA
jgi:DDE superfamily endonuclease